MENNKEQLVQFIERHAAFFDTWSNWIIIFGFIIIISILYISITRLKPVILKIVIVLVLILPLLILSFFSYLLNSPLKPFISSMAELQRALNKQIPGFEFINVKDQHVYNINEFQGKVVILNFWGTYCGPCVEEFSDLKKLEESGSPGLAVIALSEEPVETIGAFLENHVSPSLVGRFSGTAWIDLQTFKPLNLFIDKNGIVRAYEFGRKDYTYFSEQVKKYSAN